MCWQLGFVRHEVETAHVYDQSTQKWVTTGQPGYDKGTKFDLIGDVIQEKLVFEGNFENCCEACAALKPPSAPPYPPAPPVPTPMPGHPPTPPPLPWAPFPPMGPLGSHLQDSYPSLQPSERPASYECRGVVYQRDSLTGNLRCYLKTSEHLTVYTPADVPNLVHPRIAGDFVFSLSSVGFCRDSSRARVAL